MCASIDRMDKFGGGGGSSGGSTGNRRKGARSSGGRRSSRKSVGHRDRHLQRLEMLTTDVGGEASHEVAHVSPASPDPPTESRRDENSSCSTAAAKRCVGGDHQISCAISPPMGGGIAMEGLVGEGSSTAVLPRQIAASFPTGPDGDGGTNSHSNITHMDTLLQQTVSDREVIASIEELFRDIKENTELINRNANTHIHLLEEKVRYFMEELQVAKVAIELLCSPIDKN